MRLCTKIWLQTREGKAFGDGAWDLLKRVRRVRSLRGAASEIGMAYSQAWKLVKSLEKQLGFSLLEASIGGAGGGGSTLTEKARLWVERYDVFRRDCQDYIVESFDRNFADILPSYEVASPGRRTRRIPNKEAPDETFLLRVNPGP